MWTWAKLFDSFEWSFNSFGIFAFGCITRSYYDSIFKVASCVFGLCICLFGFGCSFWSGCCENISLLQVLSLFFLFFGMLEIKFSLFFCPGKISAFWGICFTGKQMIHQLLCDLSFHALCFNSGPPVAMCLQPEF